ncbi:MAG: hypothetical protein EPO68_13260 [Planctomycetota bacterium]|nr:MAG: hypothetical protein EPO68_13260 [Planctomycetota bacterium]
MRRFDASGHYRAESPPGSGNYVEKDGWRLATLTVAGSDGVAQIRVLGPHKTVAHWMPSVEAFKTQLVP